MPRLALATPTRTNPDGPMTESAPPIQHPDPRRYVALAPAPPQGAIALPDLWPGRSGPIEIEIGFGRGMFLLERARAAPEARLLGIEIKRKWAYLVSQRAQRMNLHGVRVFGADARDVLSRLTPDHSVQRVFMHFPDPWWKKRHAKRRLRGEQTLDPIARLLAPGGELFIQTDVDDRAQTFADELRAHGEFELPESTYLAENPYRARSNREKRACADDLPIFRIQARRRA
jgi:tRNA (guanine-N7-)-methyltransferase